MQRLFPVQVLRHITVIIHITTVPSAPCCLSAGFGATVLLPVFGVGMVAVPRPARTPSSAVAFALSLFQSRFYKDKTLLRKKIFFRLCRRVRKIEKTGYITVNQARGLLSLLGWLTHINGCGFYKEHICGIAPRYKLKKNREQSRKKGG